MKLKSASLQTLNPRHFMLASALLLTSACQANDQVSAQVNTETPQLEESSTNKIEESSTNKVEESSTNKIEESSTIKVKESSAMKVNQTAECPIISSSNWSAQIETSEQGRSMLAIKGDIELPSPGYSVVLEPGMADKSATPSQHFNLKAEQLDGMYIQMITPMTLQHSVPAIAKQYRSIVIHCDDQIIASIDNVAAQ
ncbi:MAG: hypothetical protein ACI9SP_004181 [Arenicella sp.]|jgi:hypothetical protein